MGETLRAALNSLAVVCPDWLKSVISPDWFDRYRRRVEDYRLPQRQSERDQMAFTMGADGHHLVSAIDGDEQVRDWVSQIPAVQVLRQVWIQQFYVDAEQQLPVRGEAEGQPPAAQLICSPYEVEARFSRKRQTQ
jgi:hypothetical protein